MNATALSPMVGVDLSKNVFELAIADDHRRVVERARLTRSQFERWFANRAVGLRATSAHSEAVYGTAVQPAIDQQSTDGRVGRHLALRLRLCTLHVPGSPSKLRSRWRLVGLETAGVQTAWSERRRSTEYRPVERGRPPAR